MANNTAHMYLALTQGDESFLSQSAVNLWVPPVSLNTKNEEKKEKIQRRKKEVQSIIEYIKRLQHAVHLLNCSALRKKMQMEIYWMKDGLCIRHI